jgi:hypothetical protein
MMDKNDLNKHSQTKEYFNPKVEYKYVEKNVDFKIQVKKLRTKYPNDADFGQAVARLLNQNNNIFPGIQNL